LIQDIKEQQTFKQMSSSASKSNALNENSYPITYLYEGSVPDLCVQCSYMRGQIHV